MQAQLNLGYLDDISLGGSVDTVAGADAGGFTEMDVVQLLQQQTCMDAGDQLQNECILICLVSDYTASICFKFGSQQIHLNKARGSDANTASRKRKKLSV